MRISTQMLYQMSNNDLTNMQSQLLKLNQQVSAGQKVLVPSDDPVASARALDLKQSQDLNAQYKINRQNANSSLAQVASTLSSFTDMLTKLKSDVIKAGNQSFSNAERTNLAAELKGNFQEVLGYANVTDGQGNYLFSGFKSTTQPFTLDGNGNAVYNGDQGAMSLQVDSSRQMEISTSGQSIFQGNGQDIFQTMNNLINVLSMPVTEAANQADETAANTFEYPAGSGQFPIQAYKTAQATLDATDPNDPAYAANFSAAAAAKLKADAAEAARTPVTGSQAYLTKQLAKFNTQFDGMINNVGTATASVGARQNELDSLDAAGETKNVNYTATINDLLGRNTSDMSELISDLTLKQTYLAAAQKVFVSTSSLTLLNYLK
ncbi:MULTISPECIES: flagellar hook-associated protein FlgL [unclassified Herbaspirillum]|uniref:flagellar hook-associated protein FlgL n=1 Tax=unclassified Herbaspirillum TaxID=2624150 RepID=UPI00115197CA|nr:MULTISPECIES: flagellar hook-associated protein FlgL [unclassified Herbaspirillum]TQK04437.1 flagellar hook-associated protein 3 FlgL [Herbaspirillum sp. SJZ130]TQK09778.1 flagellar hook-associated protein 3 FlgL [Herbaspirillum sp. SJZ106]TWC65872.1 flagellar hook-associated protein 3 FlgL [Herbaspirillum sp. SJZ099]